MQDVEAGSPEAREISVDEVAALMLDQAAMLAWQKLGLQPDSATGKIAADLEAARMAIDLCAAISGVILPRLDAEDERTIRNLIRDLRMNHVAKSGEVAS